LEALKNIDIMGYTNRDFSKYYDFVKGTQGRVGNN
jgi:hypothetical protein